MTLLHRKHESQQSASMAVRRLLRIGSIPARTDRGGWVPCARGCRGKPRPFAHPSGLYSSPGGGCHAVFGLECIARLARKDLDAPASTTPPSARRFSALLCAPLRPHSDTWSRTFFGRAHLRPTATALRAECASLNRVPCVTVPPHPTSSGSVRSRRAILVAVGVLSWLVTFVTIRQLSVLL